MIDKPDISVVMSVYNDAAELRRSVDSILSQEGVNLELIVIDDGSTDHSATILQEYAGKDERVRVINQENKGLTRALSVGCAAARGEFIARQDAGDISLPGRLTKQLDLIRQNPDSAFVSCGTRFVGPKGEHLYEVSRATGDATAHLLTLNEHEIRGPSSHPSTLFSRRLYERAGGYRSAFYFAQDLDLWIRLAELGKHVVISEVLYEASVTVESISGSHRKEQVALTAIILEGARLRRQGLSEQQILDQAESVKPYGNESSGRIVRARAFYFIGSCLMRRKNPQAAYYFRQALKACPFHVKSALRLLVGGSQANDEPI
jgi:glycosyltransferase involved in cell wall biosynthesis